MSTEQTDADRVSQVAANLEIDEYEVFKLAYQAWHACLPEEKLLDSAFASFLAGNDIPHWVRHFVREIEFECIAAMPREAELVESIRRCWWVCVCALGLTGARRDAASDPNSIVI